ncbi:hypothetical protein ScPMuIL_012125 [Solemya velum]
MYQPSKAYASFSDHAKCIPTNREEYDKLVLPTSQKSLKPTTTSREIQVTAIGEIVQPPDRCRLVVQVSSVKDNVQDVKNSITRRTEYIIQTLRNHGIKDNEIEVHKNLRRLDSAFQFDVEIQAVFSDLNKSQSVANLLVEKLDDTVTVCPIQYFHAASTLANIRQQASMLAISNCKQKAQDMARFVYLTIGKPLRISEDEWKEWEGVGDPSEGPTSTDSIHQKLQHATYNVSCKVSVSFELKPKVKTKSAK